MCRNTKATVQGWLWDVLLQPVKSKGHLLNEDTIDHIKTIISQKGSDAWWYMKVEELLPEKYRDKASDYVKGTDTMDVWFDSGLDFVDVIAKLIMFSFSFSIYRINDGFGENPVKQPFECDD
ncbi:unnamed protein product [Lactuca saligna]|uniref:Aminoacyl-tRNA synthetase class Ia domain-containing protein n=1 Tax=Lactuca saligna TaxID=75948 RepID=A0AA35ZKW9_LACSI|nr:unnamed protein product [Lactuca saligna]